MDPLLPMARADKDRVLEEGQAKQMPVNVVSLPVFVLDLLY